MRVLTNHKMIYLPVVIFEVCMALVVKMIVFWNVTV